MDEEELPRRPVLRPGIRVVRRDDEQRQLGCDPGRRAVLPDSVPARRLLGALVTGRRIDVDSPRIRRWVRHLAGQGLLVDAEDVAAARREAPSYDVAMAALAGHGSEAVLRLRARQAARVVVDTADDGARAEVDRLLARAGLRPTARQAGAAVRLVVSVDGEPLRSRTDPWMRGGLPHLFVTHRAGRLVVGPFVAPGLTACLRCRDAHEGEADPGHVEVVEQQRPRGDDRPDPVLLDLALAWAVRDLVAYVEGDRPATWSAVVDVDPDLRLSRKELTRHPRCGCSWGDGLATA